MGALLIRCPATCLTIDTGVATDLDSIATCWDETIQVHCPHCGTMHGLKMRDGFIATDASASVDLN
ncbi:MAG: hypothetical protein QOD74_996 [Variibacter sp.]|jgi:hypothetical protein|nr:hypothetical protein [Variibacter sp.]